MGATATGKSDLAIEIAEKFGGEIISMDSRQVYRGFDIGTGKVTPNDRRRVAHHLIDNLEPDEINSAGAHLFRAKEAFEKIQARGKIGLFVGGTGLYFRALFEGLIPTETAHEEKNTLRNRLDEKTTEELFDDLAKVDNDRARSLAKRDRVRILRSLEIFYSTGEKHSEHIAAQNRPEPWTGLNIVLTMPRAILRDAIARRTRGMYKDGWCGEVRAILDGGVGLDAPAMNGLGYNLIGRAILEGDDPEDTVDRVITLTQQYAKRQETFFRSVPNGVWVDVAAENPIDRVKPLVRRHLEL